MHLAFLSNWQPLYGSATVYVKSSSEIYGGFKVYLRGYFNASVGSITIEPAVPFNSTVQSENQINLDISHIRAGQVLKINVNRICLTNLSFSLNYPFVAESSAYLDVVPPDNLNATVFNNSVVTAQTPFGNRAIYGVSYAVNYLNGDGRYLDYPYHWHDFYRILDFFDLLFFAGSVLIVGVVAYAGGWVGKRYPFLTFSLLIISVAVYLIFGTAYSLIYGQYGNILSLWIVFALSPFFHGFYYHIADNLTGLIPLSLIVESGLLWSSWKLKCGTFLFTVYASTWITELFFPFSIPPTGHGLSFTIIWLGVLYALIVSRYRLFSCRSHLIYSLVAGYCLLSSTYGWISATLTNPLKIHNLGFAYTHVVSFAIACITLWLILGKIASRHEIIMTKA